MSVSRGGAATRSGAAGGEGGHGHGHGHGLGLGLGLGMTRVVWGLVLLLAVVHYDFWYWDDRSLVFGFLPIGLAYHALFSVACGVVWALAVRFAWPAELEAWADEGAAPPPGQGDGGPGQGNAREPGGGGEAS